MTFMEDPKCQTHILDFNNLMKQDIQMEDTISIKMLRPEVITTDQDQTSTEEM